jgi:hypothetical protein
MGREFHTLITLSLLLLLLLLLLPAPENRNSAIAVASVAWPPHLFKNKCSSCNSKCEGDEQVPVGKISHETSKEEHLTTQGVVGGLPGCCMEGGIDLKVK